MIYIVTKGCYSDYHIVGATTDKEKAEEMCEFVGGDVEEYEDCKIDFKNKNMYRVSMDINGDTKSVGIVTDILDVSTSHTKSYEGNLVNYCWATDEQHAVKITNELRTRLIANGEW